MEMSEFFFDSQFENEEGRGRRKSLVSVKYPKMGSRYKEG